MIINVDLKDYDQNAAVFKREAARGIIKCDDKYLMITSKYGDYKFPGGGVKNGEGFIEALIREVREETGRSIINSSINKHITVIERRRGMMGDTLEMESQYFFCEIDHSIAERDLDDYEKGYEYKEVWVSLSEAFERNKMVPDFEKCPWVTRENIVIRKLLEDIK